MDTWIVDHKNPTIVISYLEELNIQLCDKLIVCFDYFDTLVTRSVEPEHTKVVACELLHKALKLQCSGNDLYELRRELELEMTTANGRATGELDFRLDTFAVEFYKVLKDAEKQWDERVDEEQFTSMLLDIELSVEKVVQRCCPQMIQVVDALQQIGVKTLLVSDFYLPEVQFRAMVESQGLAGCFRDIYVSSTRGKSKGSGTLYPEICALHNCHPQDVLMIGDNAHADISMAEKHGLRTLHVVRPELQKQYASYRQRRESNSHIHQEAMFGEVAFPQVPFKEMGASLWLFIHRLFSELHKHNVRDVFFLSKEGEFLKALFDSYQKSLFGKRLIQSHYLIASRKATFIASLRPLEKEDFGRLLNHYKDLSIREFLQSLNFSKEDTAEIIDRLPFDCEFRLPELAAHPHFKALLMLHDFQKKYENIRSEQSANFRKYVSSFVGDVAQKGMCLVDVGWKGSIQDNIFHVFEGSVNIMGYYIGSYNPTELWSGNTKRGILFENREDESEYFHVYNNNRSLFEMLLGASHGSAERYLTEDKFNDSQIVTARVYESRIVDGESYTVLVLDHPEERELFNRAIKPIQDAFLKYFVQLTAKYIEAECTIPSNKWFSRHHARMVYLPDIGEIEFFEDLYHLENFGIFEFTNFQTNHTFTIFERLRNLKNIVLDPPVLEIGIWPPILLRRFGVGFWQKVDGRLRYFRQFKSLKRHV